MNDLAKPKCVNAELLLHFGNRLIYALFYLLVQSFLGKRDMMHSREIEARIIFADHPLSAESNLNLDFVAFKDRMNLAAQIDQIQADLSLFLRYMGSHHRLV